jgi:hypothetical protein
MVQGQEKGNSGVNLIQTSGLEKGMRGALFFLFELRPLNSMR